MVKMLYLVFLVCPISVLGGEDFYKLLGVPRHADNKEIRKAFKKLALKLHPDKNDEEGAHEKFLKINRAYEVLKDEEARKKYDMFGEQDDDEKGRGSNYQSWNYYNDDFGIYDDDPEVVTLDAGEFRRSVMESHHLWFINFYSPRCGHCHDLAPAWRKLAKEVAGAVRIGAVNCQEEVWLCRQQGVTGYPRLLLYTMDQGTRTYTGRRELEDLVTFVSSKLNERIVDIWPGNVDKWVRAKDRRHSPWLMILCPRTPCLNPDTRRLLGASLDGLASVGLIDCEQDLDLCKQMAVDDEHDFGSQPQVVFYPDGVDKGEEKVKVMTDITDHKDVVGEVLALLPDLMDLDKVAVGEMLRRLEERVGPSWLVMFVLGGQNVGTEWRKLASLLPRMRIGKIDCEVEGDLCSKYNIHKFPGFAVFKMGGGSELYYGRGRVTEVANWGRLASQARTMESLRPDLFPTVIQENNVVIDFFTPWCPPCMNFLPEFRKASTYIGGSIIFGTVDCSLHGRLCNQHGIRSYPSTIFFNSSKPHRYSGGHSSQELADFVQDTLRPVVISLTTSTFHTLVGNKEEDDVWLVDYFAPWCGPCKALTPEWRRLARSLSSRLPWVHVAQVNCEEEPDLCDSQAVNSYPTVRLYPMGSRSSGRYHPLPQNVNRDSESLEKWMFSHIPSKVTNLTPYSFRMQVLGSSQPWLVDFYTPWCGHCSKFAPLYEQMGHSLSNLKIKLGKVDCERYQQLCSTAGIKGYPTIRFYRGSDKGEDDYIVEDIKSQDPDVIAEKVEEKLKMSLIGDSREDNSVNNNNNSHDEL